MQKYIGHFLKPWARLVKLFIIPSNNNWIQSPFRVLINPQQVATLQESPATFKGGLLPLGLPETVNNKVLRRGSSEA